jgi:hypothetical protein
VPDACSILATRDRTVHSYCIRYSVSHRLVWCFHIANGGITWLSMDFQLMSVSVPGQLFGRVCSCIRDLLKEIDILNTTQVKERVCWERQHANLLKELDERMGKNNVKAQKAGDGQTHEIHDCINFHDTIQRMKGEMKSTDEDTVIALDNYLLLNNAQDTVDSLQRDSARY